MTKKVFSPNQGKTPGVLVIIYTWSETNYFIPHWKCESFSWVPGYRMLVRVIEPRRYCGKYRYLDRPTYLEPFPSVAC